MKKEELKNEVLNKCATNSPRFNFDITDEELKRATCTHRRGGLTGKPFVRINGDGTVTCIRCGTTFKYVEPEKEDIEDLINTSIEMMKFAKAMYLGNAFDIYDKAPYEKAADRIKEEMTDEQIKECFKKYLGEHIPFFDMVFDKITLNEQNYKLLINAILKTIDKEQTPESILQAYKEEGGEINTDDPEWFKNPYAMLAMAFGNIDK